jgi:non-specific serine/threonine protein kinase
VLLPPEASGFVGRRQELTTADQLLADARLVTITGTGGVGKTRLAVRAARAAADRYPDGVHLIELSAVRAPGLVAHAVANRLAIPVADSRTQFEAILGYLRERQLLLILDTCEHLIDECARLADSVLREAPGVTILATSRQPLDVPGEATMLLCPLPVPDPCSPAVGQADAVELFAQRAASVLPDFQLSADNLADVIRVCQRFDGIPLAIELATVRLRALPLRELAEGIEGRLRVLTAGEGGTNERHQTLRAAIEWSYALCTPAEQLLWARLSVFAGPFDIAAAEQACADGELAGDAIVQTLVALVDKSVLSMDSAPHGAPCDVTRYRMLDTLRDYGAERLRLAGGVEETRTRSRFIAHYLTMAVQFDANTEVGQLRQYRALRCEHANLRAAFEYALASRGDESAAIAMATSLNAYWPLSGQLFEGEYWLDLALERCPAQSPVRARVLAARALAAVLLGDFSRGRTDADAALELAARYSDMLTSGRAYAAKHRLLTWTGDLTDTAELAEKALTCLRAAGATFDEALMNLQASVADLQASQPVLAIEHCERGLLLLPEDELYATGYLLNFKALALAFQGEVDQASELARAALRRKHQLGDVHGTAFALETLGLFAVGQQRPERAAWLFGATEPLWDQVGRLHGGDGFTELRRMTEDTARDALGAARFDALFSRGLAAGLDQVVACAIADVDQLDAPPGHPAGSGRSALTERELQVAALLTQGLSHREVAERIGVAKRTVDAHAGNIFAKLGISSRSELDSRLGLDMRTET